MPTSCIVPKCKTGYKSAKEKRSVFHVPKDVERLEKWEAAILGDVKLRVSHVVCDKHFEEHDILREWIKYDSNGQIIARVPYKYPKLSKNAIPTIFDEETEEEAKAVASLGKYLGSPSLASHVNASVESAGSSFVECSALAISMPNPEITNARLVVSSGDIASTDTAVVDDVKMRMQMEVTEDNSTASSTNNKPYSIHSTITISDQIERVNESLSICEQYSTVIPSHWSVSELSEAKGQRILISYAVTRKENNVCVPVTQRCVALDADRTLEYFVYGHPVETRGTMLDRTLKDVKSLSNTLQVFQWMGICNGLGINESNIPIENAFVDYVHQWRHNDCTLISKRKRCEYCTKLRNRVNQRVSSMKRRPTLKPIHQNASNPFDRRKISVLLKIIARERREKLQAERRANLFMKEQKI